MYVYILISILLEMSNFWVYFNYGFHLVINFKQPLLFLFFLLISLPFVSKDFLQLLQLLLLYCLSFMLPFTLFAFGLATIKVYAQQSILPLFLIVLGMYFILMAGKMYKKGTYTLLYFVTFVFGILYAILHSAAWHPYFNINQSGLLLCLSFFAVGLLSGLIVVVVLQLLLSYVMQTVFKFSKRDWFILISALIIGFEISKISYLYV